MKTIKLAAVLLVCALSFLALPAKADYNKNKNEGKKVPIDGGISLLVVAGAAFGAKKVFQKNQKNTPDA
jgi:hypothetical protein